MSKAKARKLPAWNKHDWQRSNFKTDQDFIMALEKQFGANELEMNNIPHKYKYQNIPRFSRKAYAKAKQRIAEEAAKAFRIRAGVQPKASQSNSVSFSEYALLGRGAFWRLADEYEKGGLVNKIFSEFIKSRV